MIYSVLNCVEENLVSVEMWVLWWTWKFKTKSFKLNVGLRSEEHYRRETGDTQKERITEHYQTRGEDNGGNTVAECCRKTGLRENKQKRGSWATTGKNKRRQQQLHPENSGTWLKTQVVMADNTTQSDWEEEDWKQRGDRGRDRVSGCNQEKQKQTTEKQAIKNRKVTKHSRQR